MSKGSENEGDCVSRGRPQTEAGLPDGLLTCEGFAQARGRVIGSVSCRPANRNVSIRQPTGWKIYKILVVVVIAVVIAVPLVIMLDAPMITIPVTGEVLVTVMMRRNPVGAHVRGT